MRAFRRFVKNRVGVPGRQDGSSVSGDSETFLLGMTLAFLSQPQDMELFISSLQLAEPTCLPQSRVVPDPAFVPGAAGQDVACLAWDCPLSKRPGGGGVWTPEKLMSVVGWEMPLKRWERSKWQIRSCTWRLA